MEPISLAAIAVIVLANLYAATRKALLSLVYGIVILAVYALQVVSAPPGLVSPSPVTQELGLLALPGQPIDPARWITFEFVHGSPTHVLLNLAGLILILPAFEERIRSARWAILFYGGGAFGALVFVLARSGGPLLLVGASAGILAAFGAYGRLYPRERVTLFLPLPGMPSFSVIQIVVLFLAIELVLGTLLPGGIAWEAHAGALLFGFAAAPVIRRIPVPGRRPARLRSLDGLRDLATTPDLNRILRETEAADMPETREAWVEKFIAGARCPRCGGPIRRRLGRLTSECGWRRPI